MARRKFCTILTKQADFSIKRSVGRLFFPIRNRWLTKKLPDFSQRLYPERGSIRTKVVQLPGQPIFLICPEPVGNTGITDPSGPHHDDDFTQISQLCLVFMNEAQHQLIIGRTFHVQPKQAVLLVQGTLNKKRWMSRHPSPEKSIGSKRPRFPVTRNLFRIHPIDVNDIAINRIALTLTKQIYYVTNDAGMGVKIVGVQNTDNVAGGHTDAFIHGIVQTVITLGNKPAYPIAVRSDNVYCSIRRTAIYDDVLDVIVGLTDDRIDTVADKRSAVIDNSNQRNFHAVLDKSKLTKALPPSQR